MFEFAVTVGRSFGQPGPGGPSFQRPAGPTARSAWPCRRGWTPHRRAAGPPTTATARGAGGRIRRRIPGRPADQRDRAITLVMLLGGPGAAEVRSLRLAGVDMGLSGSRARAARNASCPSMACSSPSWPPTCVTSARRSATVPSVSWCCAGPTAGRPLTKAGIRRIFRTHRNTSDAVRVRPHRLRHTYGTELAASGVDLLVLRELMGHANAETTAAYGAGK